ncbi:translocation/assembly module TamB domain-containing protein [Sessilibacter corallicola]|uniref:translocation/assembly module TamB domain-containing protein n=1 Tax=Sessilibacter corallicola TaxID=2904075 RepID=UPI001E54B3C5|nr:translocation/assembly module TamB domain-containing protein [Sessilibacter corallicola]MCE2026873.1 translocation/assembly module TamB domain-containing protein [Sessilibacter corallicola]
MNWQTVKKTTIKTGFYLLSAVLAFAIIIAVVMSALVFTQSGREWTLTTGIDWLNDSTALTDQQIAIELTQPYFPDFNNFQFETLEIKKHNKTWVKISEFEFRWLANDLFDKKLLIENLHASSIYYNHALSANNNTTKEDQHTEKSTTQFNIEDYLTTATVKSLAINALQIDNAIPESTRTELEINNSINYQLSSSVDFTINQALAVHLLAAPLSDNFPKLKIDVSSVSINKHSITGNIFETPNGVLSKLLKLPKEQEINADLEINIVKDHADYQLDIAHLAFPVAGEQLALNADIVFTPTIDIDDKSTWRLSVQQCELNLSDTLHNFSGTVTYPALDITADINRFPLRLISPWLLDIRDGAVDVTTHITGTANNPNFKGAVSANTHYKNVPVALEFDGFGSTQKITINTLAINSDASLLEVSGDINPNSLSGELDYNAENINTRLVEHFYSDLPKEVFYEITSASGQLFGDLRDPSGTVTLFGNGDYQNNIFSTTVDIRKNNDLVTIDTFSIELPEGKSRVNGEIDIKQLSGDISGEFNELPLYLTKLAGIELPDELSAIFNGTFNANGDFKKPKIQAEVTSVGRYENIPFKVEVIGNSDITEHTLTKLNVTAYDQVVLNANGNYKEENFTAEISADKLPTQLLNALSLPVEPGNFSAEIAASGNIRTPNLHGQIEYSTQFDQYSRDGDLENTAFTFSTEFKNEQDRLTWNSKLIKGDSSPGFIDLSLPFHDYIEQLFDGSFSDKTTLDVTVNADVGLDIASLLIDADLHRLHGQLTLKTDITGTIKAPSVHGDVALVNTRYQNILTGTVIDALNCEINAQNYRFAINDCNATDGSKGQFQVTGDLELPLINKKKFGQLNIELHTQSASILKRPEIESETTGKISVTGDFQELTASGVLNVSPLQAVLKNTADSSIAQIEVEEVYENQPQDKPGLIDHSPIINLDLTITADKQAYLRGLGIEAELGGQIKLSGTASAPQYNGEFNTIRGQFEVFGKDFELDNGSVSFVNNAVALSITGIYEQNDLRIQADMIGQNEDFQLVLSSVPSLPEDEILSYIIFGESVSDITPIKAIQLASAVQQLRGGSSSFDPIASTRELLGVDTLSVDTEKTENGENGINVGIGKYINDKVYLELERTPNPSQPWKGTIEIELVPQINLQSSTGGTSGIDSAEIIWKKDY